jgi:CPA2 family monovalent cation:H+ antiporter-2
MMVILASNVGFSPALGSVYHGVYHSRNNTSRTIEHLKPVKDLFERSVLRVSRMLIDPTTLVEYAVPVIILTLVTIFRTIYKLNCWCHIRATTEAVRTNRDEFVTNWEFSFIIAYFEMTMT